MVLVGLGLFILIFQSVLGITLGMIPFDYQLTGSYYKVVHFSQWPAAVNTILSWGLILWGIFGERGKRG